MPRAGNHGQQTYQKIYTERRRNNKFMEIVLENGNKRRHLCVLSIMSTYIRCMPCFGEQTKRGTENHQCRIALKNGLP
jgi:hypothetical protein